MWKPRTNRPTPQPTEQITRAELREILFAKMAGGDLYAMEMYQRFRRFDIAFDVFREKPIYTNK